MKRDAAAGPIALVWWRLLIVAAIFVAGYFAITVWLAPVFEPIQTHPAVLVPVILLSAAAGVLIGRLEAASLREPKEGDQGGHRRGRAVPAAPGRPRHRGRRSKREVLKSASRFGLAGLTGCGLILAQVLPPSALEWLCLGGVSLMVGGAGHAWVMSRHYESVKTARTV